jgi:uncharacterized repeat protein (TIGR03803 family)
MATFTTLANLNGTDGDAPYDGLFIDTAGDLFGTASLGGAYGYGTVFEIPDTSSGYAATPTTVANFNVVNAYPESNLIADVAGDLFGTTQGGGADQDGTVFEIAKTSSGYASTPTTLVTFNDSDGEAPLGNLVADAAGDLFGTTYGGGGNGGYGTVFEISKTSSGYASTPITLLSFNSTDGAYPSAGLIIDAAGDLFGTAELGGANGDGVVFEIAKTSSGYASTPTILTSFNDYDGAEPLSGLTFDAAGDLFGTTYDGGTYGYGTVFEIVKTGSGYASTPTTLVSFNGTNGETPQAGVIFNAAGDLFGTTTAGGAYGDGTVFEITETGGVYSSTPTTLVNFNGSDGEDPYSDLIANAAGDIFGTTSAGGIDGYGTVFEVSSATRQTDTTEGDYNGDGKSDALWQNSATGQVYEYQMNGTSIIAANLVGNNTDPTWQAVASGDFNGDGYSDILFQNVNSGQVYLWEMNGFSVIGSGVAGNNTNPAWQVVTTGDFTGDGKSDILFQNSVTGQVYEWEMNGTSVIGSGVVGNNTDPTWQVVGTGDFTGNGIDDILFQNVNTGQVYEWEMNGTSVIASGVVGNNTDPNWKVVGTGDFNGDGKADILFQNATTGQVYEWEMNGLSVIGSGVVGNNSSPAWQVVGIGDLNGDGKSDILFQNTGTGQTFAWLMNGTSVIGSGVVGNNTNPAWHVTA